MASYVVKGVLEQWFVKYLMTDPKGNTSFVSLRTSIGQLLSVLLYHPAQK